MNKYFKILFCLISFVFLFHTQILAENSTSKLPKEFNVKEFILEHLSDSYEWHVTTWGHTHISIPLPVIVYSRTTGWHVFMSYKFHQNPVYYGLTLATEGKYKGKIVERNADGKETRPFDISLTKVALSIIFNSLMLVLIVCMWPVRIKPVNIVPRGVCRVYGNVYNEHQR
jgi:F-type H+-transporting ATPase subunit a